MAEMRPLYICKSVLFVSFNFVTASETVKVFCASDQWSAVPCTHFHVQNGLKSFCKIHSGSLDQCTILICPVGPSAITMVSLLCVLSRKIFLRHHASYDISRLVRPRQIQSLGKLHLTCADGVTTPLCDLEGLRDQGGVSDALAWHVKLAIGSV